MVLFAKNNMGNNVTDLGSCRQQTTRRSTLPAFLRRKTLKQEIIYEDRPDYYFKLVLLGDAGSGKSTLAREFSCNACRAVYQKRPSDTDTKTVEFVDRIITCRKKNVLARLYDTAGQEKFRSLTASYYRGAHGCLVLFDVTKESTFNNVQYWLHDLKEYSSNPDICTILVGTKCHVPTEERAVSFESAQKYAESVGLQYMEVSAEEGTNVTEVFETLADLIIDSLTKDDSVIVQQTNTVILKRQAEKPKKKEWCSC